jgi:large subunit ribosomal protein L1
MEDKNIINAIKTLKSESKKRNFEQKIDAIFILKDLDLKKPDQQVDFFAQLHFPIGKKIKVCAFVGLELQPESEKVCDKTISQTDFPKYQADKKLAKKLVREYDYFIAQANIMPQVAQVFGKTLGPKGKMPNPKAGCVVPPKAALKPLYDKLQTMVKVQAKTQLVIYSMVGNEKQDEKEVADNIKTLYNQIIHHLPSENDNLKAAYLKFTMGKPVKIE